MSRAKPVDNSATVSLFPFLAVLLCTMGALLVVLVAVSRSARDSALREAAAQQQTPAIVVDPKARQELEKIDEHVANLKQLRSEAEKKLREDQLRLGHLETHMRRLQDQLQALDSAAAELDALDDEHYDDRKQAEREIERLERLIAETKDTIASLKEQAASEKHTYALIPYEGPNGTYRRPIYIECLKDELVLQPEGVRITREDLRPPLGPGNPLASALRAARDHFVQLHPAEGTSRDTEPYPLLVVRPEGLIMYDRARRAIEGSDFEFGFELVEEDWELKYPLADPQLASTEQQAIDQARIRQQALAAAAPRAYRHPALAASGRFEVDGEAEGFGYSDYEGSTGGSSGDDTTHQLAANDSERAGSPAPPIGGGDGVPDTENSDATATASPPEGSVESAVNGTSGTEPNGNSAVAAGESTASGDALSNAASRAGGASGGSSIGENSGQQVVASSGAPDQEGNQSDTQPVSSEVSRGKDWALGRKRPNAVAIRRTIQVVVRNDHIAILSDDAQTRTSTPSGKSIALQGDTVESLDQIVGEVHKHIEGWGMAGDGLYWRPVLILNVGPDGRRRAEDLARLLKGSGLELRTGRVANNQPQEDSRATR